MPAKPCFELRAVFVGIRFFLAVWRRRVPKCPNPSSKPQFFKPYFGGARIWWLKYCFCKPGGNVTGSIISIPPLGTISPRSHGCLSWKLGPLRTSAHFLTFYNQVCTIPSLYHTKSYSALSTFTIELHAFISRFLVLGCRSFAFQT